MPSKAWDILSDTLVAERVGGYINVSGVLEEMVAGSLDMIVSPYEQAGCCICLKAGWWLNWEKLVPVSPWLLMLPVQTFWLPLVQAVTIVVQNTQQLPQWIAMGPIGWGRLIGTADLAGRPILPPVGPVNALGTGECWFLLSYHCWTEGHCHPCHY